jgi:spermidine synthase
MPNALIPIFFVSGMAGLTFETLWFRLAGLSLGNSVWSASLVLAAFMGGLTLGNGLVARFQGRILNPVRLYALLELAIGAGSFLAMLALPRLTSVLGPLLSAVADTPWLLNIVRLGSAFTLLVLPTTAMGATLPLLTEALSRETPNFGANLGRLYGWNTLGAMLGAIGTEAVLVRFVGIMSAGTIAMLLNLAAGALALRLAGTQAPIAPPVNAPLPRYSVRTYRYLLVGLLSGAFMLALEVVWFRFLLLTYFGTAFVFALMLAIVLAGIGLGGLAAARHARGVEHGHRWLPHVMAASGTFVVLTYYGYDLFTHVQLRMNATLPMFVGFATFLMLPVSLLSGAAFTLVAGAVKEELGGSIRTTGVATLWNTVGATAGSIGAGFVLLPTLGMERSIFALAGAYLVTALLVPTSGAPSRTRRLAWMTFTVAAVTLVVFPFGLMERSFFKISEGNFPSHTLIASREGLNETIRYYRRDVLGAPYFYRLVTNGYSMSSTSLLGRRYMKLFVYLPIALNSGARDALLISYGVGSTAKALTDTRALNHIDVVDISREILDMSSIIYPDSENPLHDPRVEVYVEDGRFFLSTRSRKYDLITSEPPPPKAAGVVNLYTQEYFRAIRDHLAVGGYATYWLPVHQLQPLDTLAIIRAFCGAFEDCTLWDSGGLEWMLMGSNGADTRVSVEAFTAQWRDERVRSELVELGFERPEQMGALFIADTADLVELTGRIQPVTDNYPLRISAKLVRDPGRVQFYASVMDERERLQKFERSTFIDRVWPRELAAQAAPYFRYEGLLKDYFTNGMYPPNDPQYLWATIDDLLTNTDLRTLPLWLLGSDWATQRIAHGLAERGDRSAEVSLQLALGDLVKRDYRAAQRQFGTQATDSMSLGKLSLLVYLLGKNGRVDDARAVIAQIDFEKTPAARPLAAWFEATFAASE